ncbi:ribokinase-like isoform X2 [Selaginella moellendorffii]|uniref:ribokinase-like isoform X2 n=1 Tax=Selaginella moellendorffii TaxID=88036 RepID=UPI000D1C4256|nr:ribokinase-like isoform X2 [Selaginella moellendorffii]|eukprot:XP_024542050.1 ribokinase-like isoform X2 [Selaginella moellendorffii]
MAGAGLGIAFGGSSFFVREQPVFRIMATSMKSAPLQIPSKKVVLGCGTVVIDYLASVSAFPQPDDKIRSIDFQFQGGGNVGNSLTGAARLGLKPVLISKVADDALGLRILEELKKDGVDTSHVVVAKGGVSPFTYIIIDKERLTRTCIHTPGHPPMLPTEIDTATLSSVLQGTDLVFFDCRLTDTAVKIAKMAAELKLPILVDAEKKREFLDELLVYCDYMVASSRFPEAWTNSKNLAEALLCVASKLPKLKFIIVTLGAEGCVMLERSTTTDHGETMDVNQTLDSLRQQVSAVKSPQPRVVSSKMGRLVPSTGSRIAIFGRLIVGTAQEVPAAQLADTTGAGDAFVGAVMYCNSMRGIHCGTDASFCSDSGRCELPGCWSSCRSAKARRCKDPPHATLTGGRAFESWGRHHKDFRVTLCFILLRLGFLRSLWQRLQ